MNMLGAADEAAGKSRAADAVRRYLAAIEGDPSDVDAAWFDDVEEEFVRYAAAYAEQRGLRYRQWRDAGVSAEVLERAGIQRFHMSS
jgi:hypothetical protein